MATLVLMYHKTPAGAAEGIYDVALPVFRDQINRLIDQGFEFIPFENAVDARYLGGATRVCITFDDGHKSNIPALEFLGGKGIRPASFMVSTWSRSDPAFIPPATIRALQQICDFGGHGATHRALTTLSPAELREELTASRNFLEETLGSPVSAMAVPGGHLDDRVIEMANACGYALIGNSIPLINTRPAKSVNRVVVRNLDGAGSIVQLAQQGRLFWELQRVKGRVGTAARHILGPARYASVSRRLKKAMR